MLLFLDKERTFRDELGTLTVACAEACPRGDERFADAFKEFVSTLRKSIQGYVDDGVCTASCNPEDLSDYVIRAAKISFDNDRFYFEDASAPAAAHVAWRVIHAFPYHANAEYTGEFVERLVRVFPCQLCRQHALALPVQEAIEKLRECKDEDAAAIELMRFHNTITKSVKGTDGVRKFSNDLFIDLERALDSRRVLKTQVLALLKANYKSK